MRIQARTVRQTMSQAVPPAMSQVVQRLTFQAVLQPTQEVLMTRIEEGLMSKVVDMFLAVLAATDLYIFESIRMVEAFQSTSAGISGSRGWRFKI